MQSFTTGCADGGEVALTLYGAENTRGAVVLIHPATAVRERMYWPFAAFLASKGFRVVTYNYRGVGPEARRPANRRLTMRDWMLQDMPAVTDWAVRNLPDAPLMAIGHSLGGHAIGMSGKDSSLQAAVLIAVLIASHAGALRLVRGRVERLRIGLIFRAVVPILARLSARFPGQALKIGEDMPSAAMRDWGRWILMPNYFFDDPALAASARFAEIGFPIFSYGFDDDPWATPAAIELLNSHFTASPPARRQINPASNGSGAIGHLGFFRDRHRDTLWPQVAGWLQQQNDGLIATLRDQIDHRPPVSERERYA